jgi:hypothetical protein
VFRRFRPRFNHPNNISGSVRIVTYRPVAKRWLSKQRSLLGNAATYTHETIEERWFLWSAPRPSSATARWTHSHGKGQKSNNNRTVFSMWSLPWCYKQETTLVDNLVLYGRLWSRESVEFCKGGREDRTWARKAEESPLLEAVVRERLMKTVRWKNT